MDEISETKNYLIKQEMASIKQSMKIFIDEVLNHTDQEFITSNLEAHACRLKQLAYRLQKRN